MPSEAWVLSKIESYGKSELGNFSEHVWQNVLLRSSFNIIPLCRIDDGGAPRLRSEILDNILPDFDVISGRRNAYLDSKCKTNLVCYRIANNELRHGINLSHWQEYERIEGQHLKKCCIGVLQLYGLTKAHWTGRLLANSLFRLGQPIRGHSNQSHMIYWPVRKFRVIAEFISPQELWELSLGPKKCDAVIKEQLVEMIGDPVPIQGRLF